MDIEVDELWEQICGTGSLMQLLADTHGLHYLVNDLIIEIVENDKFQAYATIDTDDGESVLIRITTGTYQKILQCISKGIEIIQQNNLYPWVDLGFEKEDFNDSLDFCNFMSKVVMDFVVVHEIGHVVRGHVDQSVKVSGIGLSEIEEKKSDTLQNLRRIALELDADSIAIYILVGLSSFLLDNSKLYERTKKIGVFIATIGLATKILFGILGEAQFSEKTRDLSIPRSLIEIHKDLIHPIPSIREEFTHQRITQLAIDDGELSIFLKSLESSYSVFLEMVGGNLFPLIAMDSWLYNTNDVADLMNILIKEIESAEAEGWMESSRISKSVNAVQNISNSFPLN